MKKNKGGFYYGENYGNGGSDSVNNADDKIKEKVGEYGNMSADKLLDELFLNAAAARQRGDLDDKKLDEFYNSVKGMLTPEQLRRLDVLMRALRGNNQR